MSLNIKKLNASEFPELIGVFKDLVNYGKYALSNEEGEYIMDINGKPLGKKKSEEIEYISICKFDGISMPPTISIPSYITI